MSAGKCHQLQDHANLSSQTWKERTDRIQEVATPRTASPDSEAVDSDRSICPGVTQPLPSTTTMASTTWGIADNALLHPRPYNVSVLLNTSHRTTLNTSNQSLVSQLSYSYLVQILQLSVNPTLLYPTTGWCHIRGQNPWMRHRIIPKSRSLYYRLIPSSSQALLSQARWRWNVVQTMVWELASW